jgi:hypothetical protein
MNANKSSQSRFWIVWAPEPDEQRFLRGVPITLLAILLLWKNGLPLTGRQGRYDIPVAFAVWWILYLLKFGKRLQRRGELGRTIVLPGIFLALAFALLFY